MNIWCTLVMIDDKYACGAAVVAQTLRNVGTEHPIWCIVSDGVSEPCIEFLESQFDRVVKVPLISHECVPMKSKKQNEIYGSWIHNSFTKWNILNPELFPNVEKVILVDADMMFLQNCDELFNLNAPALTFSSPWAKPYMKTKFGTPNPYGEMKHGQVVSKDKIMRGFNKSFLGLACMVLVKPSSRTYKIFRRILERDDQYGNPNCTAGFDEQIIAETLLAVGEPIHHIHQSYNWIVGKYDWLLNGEKPRTMQFYNGKPWNDDRNASEYEDVRDWWKVADIILEKFPEHRSWFYHSSS